MHAHQLSQLRRNSLSCPHLLRASNVSLRVERVGRGLDGRDKHGHNEDKATEKDGRLAG
jgi:hypothetical protein